MKIAFKNILGTIEALMSNANTSVREYLFQDRNGTIADDTDIAGLQTQINAVGGDIDDLEAADIILDSRLDTAETDIVNLETTSADNDFTLMTSLRNFYNY